MSWQVTTFVQEQLFVGQRLPQLVLLNLASRVNPLGQKYEGYETCCWVSRGRIGREMEMRPEKVTEAVDFLVSRGLVLRRDKATAAGRSPVDLGSRRGDPVRVYELPWLTLDGMAELLRSRPFVFKPSAAHPAGQAALLAWERLAASNRKGQAQHSGRGDRGTKGSAVQDRLNAVLPLRPCLVLTEDGRAKLDGTLDGIVPLLAWEPPAVFEQVMAFWRSQPQLGATAQTV